MGLVSTKCYYCGAFLQVENQDAAICSSCGKPFIVAKSIQLYELSNKDDGKTKQNQLADCRKRIESYKNLITCRHYRDGCFIGNKPDGTIVAFGNKDEKIKMDLSKWKDIVYLSNTGPLTGLKSNGELITTLDYDAFSKWKDIEAIMVCSDWIVGKKKDGYLIADGFNNYGQCNVSDWCDIKEVVVGNLQSSYYTIGLKVDGTVLSTGYSVYNATNVYKWKDIVSIATSGEHTVGLKADGTVVAVGSNGNLQCEVSSWNNIVSIACGLGYTIGLKSNGKVVSTSSYMPTCDVSEWKDIVYICCSTSNTVGIKLDGTVEICGSNTYGQCNVVNWHDIIKVIIDGHVVVGIRSDGTVVAAGEHITQNTLKDVKLFDNIETIDEERKKYYQKRQQEKAQAAIAFAERRIAIRNRKSELLKQRNELKNELIKTTGLFNRKKKKEIEDKISVIDKEIQSLG